MFWFQAAGAQIENIHHPRWGSAVFRRYPTSNRRRAPHQAAGCETIVLPFSPLGVIPPSPRSHSSLLSRAVKDGSVVGFSSVQFFFVSVHTGTVVLNRGSSHLQSQTLLGGSHIKCPSDCLPHRPRGSWTAPCPSKVLHHHFLHGCQY